MYTSTMFQGRVSAVQAGCDCWFVLSAKHGLLTPDDVIEPYDVALKELPAGEKQAWSQRVLLALDSRVDGFTGKIFEIHAGSAYRDNGLVAGIRAGGGVVENPVAGLNFGQQLGFYRTDIAADPQTSSRVGPVRPSARYHRIGELLEDSEDEVVLLTYAQVEDAIGRPLPPSASKYRTWWGNTEQSPQGRGWLSFGWRVAGVNGGSVQFERVPLTRVQGQLAGAAEVPRSEEASRSPIINELHLDDIRPSGPFSYRWPEVTEKFTHGWEATVLSGGVVHALRHGIGGRTVFGTYRAHSVTFLDGRPAVEGTAEDDYPLSQTLVSLIKGSDQRDIRSFSEIPRDYDQFSVARQSDCITGPYVRSSLVVRLAADDLEGWARHALLRTASRGAGRASKPVQQAPSSASPPPIASVRRTDPADSPAVVQAMLDYGVSLGSIGSRRLLK
jgi:hypothetical protein